MSGVIYVIHNADVIYVIHNAGAIFVFIMLVPFLYS